MPRDLDLDEKVAEALGWKSIQRRRRTGSAIDHLQGKPPDRLYIDSVPWWSSDIAAAWMLAEKYNLSVIRIPGQESYLAGRWTNVSHVGTDGVIAGDLVDSSGTCRTAPEAISRAVLEIERSKDQDG